MNQNDLKILNNFAQHIRQQFPEAAIWAYGSRVKDTAFSDSDLDICIVVDKLNEDIDGKIIDIAWEIGFDNDILISTVTYSREEFESGPCSESPLVKTILAEGIAA